MSVGQLCQQDRPNGFRPLVNSFSNGLTFPHPPPHPFFSQCLEAAETYISLSVFLIVVFLYGLSFFLDLLTKNTIDPTSNQTNKSTRTRARTLETFHFRLTFSKGLYPNMVMPSEFFIKQFHILQKAAKTKLNNAIFEPVS